MSRAVPAYERDEVDHTQRRCRRVACGRRGGAVDRLALRRPVGVGRERRRHRAGSVHPRHRLPLAQLRRRASCGFNCRARSGGRLGRARGPRPLRRGVHRSPTPGATRRSHAGPRRLDGPGGRPRHLPGRRRPDPRGDHRVRSLPLPCRRRAHPAPRPAPFLQAPRARARRRGALTRRRPALCAARLCRRCRHQCDRVRAGLRVGARAVARPCAATGAHAAARARAPLQPPQRHIARFARASDSRPPRCSSPASRSALSDSTSDSPGTGFSSIASASVPAACRFDRSTPMTLAPSCASCDEMPMRGGARCCSQAQLQERFEGVGCLTREAAERHGTVGPVARAAGVADDARLRSPRLWYAGFSPASPPAPTGDVAARVYMRAAELASTFDCLDELFGRPSEPGRAIPDRESTEHGLATVESPRGQTLCAVRLDDRMVARMHLRTASRANWPALSTAVRRAPARLPPDQQELRALLRLRRSLMFVLLRQLHRMRREIGLPGPTRRGSLALRHVDAGSCNGCEHELNAVASPFYDLQRFGLNVVASPRHADVLLVTGAITTRMRQPLLDAYAAMPEPRMVAALGDCALGRGVLADPSELAGATRGAARGRYPGSRLPAEPGDDRRGDPRAPGQFRQLRPHNPEVAGSNPARAITRTSWKSGGSRHV